MEKKGVFSRVKSRWRSIFSKKNNPVKLRDNNRINATIMENQLKMELDFGTIIKVANGLDFVENEKDCDKTTKFNEEKTEKEGSNRNARRRIYRLSSGELNFVRRMTEEVDFRALNVIYDGNEITGEVDNEAGTERACFKPGLNYPTDQQMVFLKQCLNRSESRPSNMFYLTQGWTVPNFEGLLKYMMKSENCTRSTFLRVEFRDCIPSLAYLSAFIEDYASSREYTVDVDYVYGTLHSRKIRKEKKLRGELKKFLEIESKLVNFRFSYLCTFSITSPTAPNVLVAVRFACLKPCNSVLDYTQEGLVVQLDQITGSQQNFALENDEKAKVIDQKDLFDDSCENMTADQTDCVADTTVPKKNGTCKDARSYYEMFPLLSLLIEKAENRKKMKEEMDDSSDGDDGDDEDSESDSESYSSSSETDSDSDTSSSDSD